MVASIEENLRNAKEQGAINPQPCISEVEDSEKYFGNSKTLRTPVNRKMVMMFVRDQYPQARFERIYDANTHGWKEKNFHSSCDNQGWTLTIVQTTYNYIFGGFTTAELESPPPFSFIEKPDPCSFMFSVNEGSKYPITEKDSQVIECNSNDCVRYGENGAELVIYGDSNSNDNSQCLANNPSFKLPPAKGQDCEKGSSSINGGKRTFKSKEFEVYRVFVRL